MNFLTYQNERKPLIIYLLVLWVANTDRLIHRKELNACEYLYSNKRGINQTLTFPCPTMPAIRWLRISIKQNNYTEFKLSNNQPNQ